MRFNTYCGGCLAEGTGKKRKAPAKNSSADSSQLEEGTEAEETQQVDTQRPLTSHLRHIM